MATVALFCLKIFVNMLIYIYNCFYCQWIQAKRTTMSFVVVLVKSFIIIFSHDIKADKLFFLLTSLFASLELYIFLCKEQLYSLTL